MIKPHQALLFSLVTSLSAATYADPDSASRAHAAAEGADSIAVLEGASDQPEAQLALAKRYRMIDLDRAEDWIEKAIQSSPESAEANYVLGLIKGEKAQNATFSALRLARQSKQGFEKAVALEPGSATYVEGLIRYHLSAPGIAGGDLAEAQILAERLEALDPPRGVLAKANVAQASDDPQLALQLLDEGLSRYGHHPVLALRAGLLYQSQEDFDRAFALFEQASASDDATHHITGLAALYQLGRTAVFSGAHTQEGIDALTTYLKTAPEHQDLVEKPWAEFRLALLYEQDGRLADANAIFERLRDADDKRLRKAVSEHI